MTGEIEWYQFKLFLHFATSVDMDTLHVLIGVLAQLAFAGIFRTSVKQWAPWLAVLTLEVANEWNDLRVEQWPDAGMQYGEGFKDILLTMLLPTVIMIVARYRPKLLSGIRV